jgi:hypothetical protein
MCFVVLLIYSYIVIIICSKIIYRKIKLSFSSIWTPKRPDFLEYKYLEIIGYQYNKNQSMLDLCNSQRDEMNVYKIRCVTFIHDSY